MSQLLDVLFGGGAESPLDRIIRQNGFTPGINPTASHPLTTLPGNNPSAGPAPMPNPLQTQLGAPESDMAALARQNNFGGDPVTSNVSDRRISATADRNTRGERGIEKILGAFGGPGRAVRDFISPATNALGTIIDVAEGVAAKGGLSSIAPNFSAGVQAAAQRELDEAYRRAQLQIERDKIAAQALNTNATAGNVQSTFQGANGNMWIVPRGGGKPIDTGVAFDKNLYFKEMPDGSVQAFNRTTGAQVGTPISPEEAAESSTRAAVTESTAEEQADAVVELPQAALNLQTNIRNINSLRNHPGLSSAVGFRFPKDPIMGTEAASFVALLDQVMGGAFKEAFESLKGGGQITEIEAEKAEQAITRLRDRDQTEESWLQALTDYENAIKEGFRKLAKAAEGDFSVSDEAQQIIEEL